MNVTVLVKFRRSIGV